VKFPINAISIGLVLFSYLLGSIPFSVALTRWLNKTDLRDHGSGHAGTTNVLRLSGWWPAVVVLLWDLGKGYVAVSLAQRMAAGWVVPAVALAVVFGHCWPVFAGFRGGMGVAASGGALLAVWPLGFVLAVGLDAALTLLLRHAARANLATGLSLWLLLLIFGADQLTLSVALAVGIVVSIRAQQDWDRQYRELWLDRDSRTKEN
jgi:glycerol-3-phosphate acyltransferase PlsY